MLRARTLGVGEDDNTDEYNFKDDDYYTLEVFHTSVPERSRLSRVSRELKNHDEVHDDDVC